MSIRTLVVDSGGTTRLVANGRFFVVDSGGTTRAIQRLFVIDSGGTARQVYQGVVYSLPSLTVSAVHASAATATISLLSAGTFSTVGTSVGTVESGNWVTPTSLAPGSYTIRCHQNSGDALNGGDTLDVDHALTSNRSFSLTRSGAGAGTSTASVTLTLKDGGGVTVATTTMTLSAQTFS